MAGPDRGGLRAADEWPGQMGTGAPGRTVRPDGTAACVRGWAPGWGRPDGGTPPRGCHGPGAGRHAGRPRGRAQGRGRVAPGRYGGTPVRAVQGRGAPGTALRRRPRGRYRPGAGTARAGGTAGGVHGLRSTPAGARWVELGVQTRPSARTSNQLPFRAFALVTATCGRSSAGPGAGVCLPLALSQLNLTAARCYSATCGLT